MAENSSPEEKNLLKQVRITETMGLAAVPLIAYCVVFLYWAGYLNYFDIPLEFIPFNLPEVFIVAAAILGVLAFLLGGANLVFTLVIPRGRIPIPVARRLIQLSPLYLLVIPFFLINEWGSTQWFFLILIIVATLIVFGPPLFMRKVKGTYVERLEASDKSMSTDIFDKSLVGRFADRFGGLVFAGVVYLVLILNLVYNVGQVAAINQRLFRVASTLPETVVILFSGDNVICTPFDRNTKTVAPSFIVLPLSGSTGITFSLEAVGPLHLNTAAINSLPTPLVLPAPTSTVPNQSPVPTP